jgi:hypothetical protein
MAGPRAAVLGAGSGALKRARPRTTVGYEARDVAPRHILYAGGSLFVGIAVSIALVAGLMVVLDRARHNTPATAMETTPLAPPLPRLEIDGRADRAAVEADAQRKLDGYAWVDRSAGIVRIPIARAMQLLAARGWPDTPKGAGAP